MCDVVGPRERAPPQLSRLMRPADEPEMARRRRRTWASIWDVGRCGKGRKKSRNSKNGMFIQEVKVETSGLKPKDCDERMTGQGD